MSRLILRPFARIKTQLFVAAESNGNGANSIAGASENISAATSQQVASVRSLVQMLTQIKSIIETTGVNVREADKLGAEIKEKTEAGAQGMRELDSAMSEIESANSQV